MSIKKLQFYTREINKLKERRSKDNWKRSKSNYGHSNKSILEECRFFKIESKRENREKLLRIPNRLMFNK